MGRDRGWHKRAVAIGESGQSTVEYAVVAAALTMMVVGMGALWRFFSDGSAVSVVIESLTHALPWGVLDVSAF